MLFNNLNRFLCVLFSLGSLSVLFTACQSNDSSTQVTPPPVAEPQQPFSGKLPITDRLVKGQLENGIGYIIQQNSKPVNRVEIRLVVDIGSLAEDETQLGFAHFAEHMAFNGTEDFEKQEIIEYIESIGMKFGAHLNAHTSFDETVYKLQMPTNDQATIEKGFHILENWAHKISFEPEEIDKERGVVIEELRRRKGAQDRVFQKQLPVLYKGSRHALRLPIGKEEILKDGKHEDLIRFYKDWYRPDLMSIVVVGDVEPELSKALIEKYFNKVQPVADAKVKQTYPAPDNIQPNISIETDPELTRTIVRAQIKQPLIEVHDYAQLEQQMVRSLFTGMLNNRYREAVLKPATPIINGGTNFSRLLTSDFSFGVAAMAKPSQSKESLAFLLTEFNRVLQNGFTADELTRQKVTMLRSAEKSAKEIDKTNSGRLASQYVSHFLKDTALMDPQQYFVAYQHFLPKITLKEVNQLASKLWKKENRLVSISAPDKDKNSLPTEQQVSALWEKTAQQNLQAYTEEKVPESLMAETPKAGTVVSKKYDEKLDAHIWQLSNGANVILKVTDFKADEILFSASSEGGNSLLDNEQYLKTLMATYIVDAMGLGEMNTIQLGKYLKGKRFSLKARIDDLHQSLSGSSSIQDLEEFFRVLHLKFQKPRVDKQAFDTLIARVTPYYKGRLDTPSGVFSEELRLAQYTNDPRSVKMGEEIIQQQELQSSLEVYQQRFANAGQFNFAFVGNLDLEKMEHLVSTYMASLPSSAESESWRAMPDMRTKGNLQVKVKKGLEPKATVELKYYGESSWSFEQSAAFNSVKSVLSTVLRERIREEKSGVYGVSVRGGFSRHNNTHNMRISFTCDPERVDELIKETQVVVNEFKTQKQDEKYLTNYKKHQVKRHETDVKQNDYWLEHLLASLSKTEEFQSFEQKFERINGLTEAALQTAAQRYLGEKDTVVATLLPETKKAKTLH